MNLHVIETGLFKLDGGAMFGVVPKTIWQKLITPDSNNLCTWSMRCLLIESGDRLILIDCGLGDKQSQKFFSYYDPHGDDSLEQSLKNAGFSRDDITDVLLTHLHFDHCGGAVERDQNGNLQTAFKNATYWSHQKHWDWAVNPNNREKASFLKENFMPIEESGQLKFLEEGEQLIEGVRVELVHGHTESMIIPHIAYNGKTMVYMADLLPSANHIPIPYVMGYDVRPLITMTEKAAFLEKAVAENYILFFEHDTQTECCDLQMTEKGVREKERFALKEIL